MVHDLQDPGKKGETEFTARMDNCDSLWSDHCSLNCSIIFNLLFGSPSLVLDTSTEPTLDPISEICADPMTDRGGMPVK